MNNYYEFNDLSTNVLNTYLEEFTSVFKAIFNRTNYDEFYCSCKFLIEELSDIKFILNILKDRDNE